MNKGNRVVIRSKRYGVEGVARLVNKLRDFQNTERWEVQFERENRLFKRTIKKQ